MEVSNQDINDEEKKNERSFARFLNSFIKSNNKRIENPQNEF